MEAGQVRAFRGLNWYPPGRHVFRFGGEQVISQFDTWRWAAKCESCQMLVVDFASGSADVVESEVGDSEPGEADSTESADPPPPEGPPPRIP